MFINEITVKLRISLLKVMWSINKIRINKGSIAKLRTRRARPSIFTPFWRGGSWFYFAGLQQPRPFLTFAIISKCVFLFLMFFVISVNAGDKCTIIYFMEKDCPDCAKINDTVLPLIIEKYGDKIEFIRRDVDKIKNFEAMMGFESKYGILPQEVPEFYTPLGVTWKPDKIIDELPKLIELAGGSAISYPYGKDFQEGDRRTKGKYADFFNNYLKTGTTGISVTESIQKQYLSKKEKLLIYEFRKSGCRSCDRLSISMNYLKKKYPGQLEIKSYNINDIKATVLNEALCIKYGIPAKRHLATPALFFGRYALNGKPNFKDKNMGLHLN